MTGKEILTEWKASMLSLKRFGIVLVVAFFTGALVAIAGLAAHLPQLTTWQIASISIPCFIGGLVMGIVDPLGGKQ